MTMTNLHANQPLAPGDPSPVSPPQPGATGNRPWLGALPSIAVASAVAVAALLAMTIDRSGGGVIADPMDLLRPAAPQLALREHTALGAAELAAARLAWNYIERNTRPETGLIDSVEGYPATTMWDLGSGMLGIAAAEGLGVISHDDARARLDRILGALSRIDLYSGALPNKVYSTTVLDMRGYDNSPTATGIGWSALDIGRMVIALRVTADRFPSLGGRVAEVMSRFDLSAAVENGELVGARPVEGVGASASDGFERVQEGRLGYEEYGARGLMLAGLDAARAGALGAEARALSAAGVDVLSDRRTMDQSGANSLLTSEPYLLTAFELGLGDRARALAWRLLLAQERRYGRTGQPLALSEDHYDRPPNFLYGAIEANGVPFAVVAEDGTRHDELRSNSTKAAFGWAALWDTPFTRAAVDAVAAAAVPGRGWAAGIYEVDGAINTAMSLNTNAVILEALHYRQRGPLLRERSR